MASTKDMRDVFDAIDVSGDGYISASELGSAMHRLGLKPTRPDVVAALLELDANGDGRVSFAEFKKYYHRFADRYLGGKVNKLLVKDMVGRTRKSGYDLPPEGHRFGKVLTRDPEGAGDVVLHWKGGKLSNPPAPPRNMLAMNAAAAAAGCTTAKEIRQFQQDNPVLAKSKISESRGSVARQRASAAPQDAIFGHKNRYARCSAPGAASGPPVALLEMSGIAFSDAGRRRPVAAAPPWNEAAVSGASPALACSRRRPAAGPPPQSATSSRVALAR